VQDASLYESHSGKAQGEVKAGKASAKNPMLAMIWANKEVLLVIFILLVLTFVCAFEPMLRLPTCVAQTLLIGLASIKWEEESWIATAPKRIVRVTLQFFLTLIPFVVSGVLIFLCIQEFAPDKEGESQVITDAQIGTLLDL
jgi:Na+-transporting methylmalonyl-CoA/oxaloacetate decarboxylase beta subunit